MITSSPFPQSPIFSSKNPNHLNKSSSSKTVLITASASASSVANTSFYEVLGVSIRATNEEVKAAYRKLARVCHPDVAAKDTSAEEFIKIHTAYSTLLDPEKRADYDRSLFRIRQRYTTLRASHSESPAVVYSRRNWETDQCS